MASNELKYQITADGTKAKAEIQNVDKAINKMAGGSAVQLQKGFKNVASEASNLMAVFTGDKLTGATSQLTSLGNVIGAIPGPAGLAAGAVAAIGTAAVGVGVALFNLTKQAEEFGSTIHDASIKTGLGAETISALKLAADESGTSLEQATSGIAKFQKLIGEAADGSDKAATKMKALGVTPQDALRDLDGALDKVFKKIGDARPTDRAALAMKAFGKSGAELVPLMEQTGFSVLEFRKHAQDLGATLTDEDAAAADAFGDQMVELKAQIAGVGRAIGFELMPEFQSMASEFSQWLSQNKDEVRYWAAGIHGVMRMIVWEARLAAWAIGAVWKSAHGEPVGAVPDLDLTTGIGPSAGPIGMGGIARSGGGRLPGDTGGGSRGGRGIRPPKETDSEFRKFFKDLGFNVTRTFGEALNKNSPHTIGGAADVSIRGKSIGEIFTLMVKSLEKGYRVFDERVPVPGVNQTGPHVHVENAKTSLTKASHFAALGFSPEQIAYLQKLDKERLGKATGTGGFEAFQKSNLDKANKDAEDAAKRRVEIGQSMTESLIDMAEHEYEENLKYNDPQAAMAAAQQVHDLKIQLIDDEINALEEQYQNAQKGSADEARLLDELNIKKIKRNALERAANDEFESRGRKVLDDQIERMHQLADIKDRELEIQAALNAADTESLTILAKKIKSDAEKKYGGRSNASQFDQLRGLFTGEGFHDQAAIAGIDAMQTAFEGLAQAIGQAVDAWILYGSAGQSARQVTAQIIAAVAQQAAVKSIFELAEGFAALARGFFGDPRAHAEAVMHFKSAATYGIVAGIAAGIGRGVAGNSFNEQRGGGSGGGASGSGQSGVDQNPTPYSRASENAYLSGQRHEITALAMEVRALHQKIGAKSPGDILVVATQQRRGHIAETMIKEVKGNNTHGRTLARSMGIS